MHKVDRRAAELNEIGWWANWGKVKWLNPDAYLLSSEELEEPFFNRAGLLSCDSSAQTVARLEGLFASSSREAVVGVFDSCSTSASSLRRRGYKFLDKMTVMQLRTPKLTANESVQVTETDKAESWCDAYLLSFYGELTIKRKIMPTLERLAGLKAVTLLSAHLKGRVVGVTALFRTPGLLGLYCLGTVPEFRRIGVAHSLLTEAKSIAEREGRSLVLQCLVSEGAVSFYYRSGFSKLYIKHLMSRNRSSSVQRPERSRYFGTTIRRDPGVGPHLLPGVFQGFDRVPAVREIFGNRTKDVLSELQVEVVEERGYMHINAAKGSVVVSANYLKEGEENYLYLDIIHELVHIRQHMEGKELWDRRYKYVDRPTELEAYEVAVAEARRLGLDDDGIADYLKVEWVTPEDFLRFLVNLGVKTRDV